MILLLVCEGKVGLVGCFFGLVFVCLFVWFVFLCVCLFARWFIWLFVLFCCVVCCFGRGGIILVVA